MRRTDFYAFHAAGPPFSRGLIVLMQFWRTYVLPWFDSNELPWLPPRWWRGTAEEREVWAWRRVARRLMWPEHVRQHGRARVLTQALVWPAWAAIKSWRHACATTDARYAGRSRLAVWGDTYWLQMAYNLRLSDQLDVGINLPENRREVRGFMVCREQQTLLGEVKSRRRGVPGLGLKREFARFCEAHALPAPTSVCEGAGDTITLGRDWPAHDLIFKPAGRSKGEGIVKLSHDSAAGAWRTQDGGHVDAGTVADWARRQVGDEDWLVQPFMRNSPSWARFTTGGLATCRVVTGRLAPDGEPFLLGAFARFPLDHAVVDNLAAGGVGAGVDLHDGRMGAGTIWEGETGHCDCHPRTGAKITGELLPGWAEIAALALRTHRAAGEWPSMGWDIACTERGVMLIEANTQWAIFFHVPMSRTRLAELFRSVLGAPD